MSGKICVYLQKFELMPICYSTYFGSDQEKDDAQKFWFQSWECCDVVNLIEGYVYAVSKLWKYRWPDELRYVYIEAYNMFRYLCYKCRIFNSS